MNIASATGKEPATDPLMMVSSLTGGTTVSDDAHHHWQEVSGGRLIRW